MNPTRTTVLTEPEMLGRKDVPGGRWQIETCNARRGEPGTSVVDRYMKIPVDDTEQARCIRAHEMMHAKVSPRNGFGEWAQRGFASLEALTVTEELRVNFLCQQAGFDVKKHLADGGETADGERVAMTSDWRGAVHMAIATAGTASNKLFLNGVRRHNRFWGNALSDISKRAVKEMKKASKYRNFASTEIDKNSGMYPVGFSYVERIAEWVDRLASIEPKEIFEEEQQESTESSVDEGDSNDEGEKPETKVVHSNRGRGRPKEGTGKKFNSIKVDMHSGPIPSWTELVVERLPMPLHTKGNIGKTRASSNIGRSPRRMHRMMTDPSMRIFDKVSRGAGGVVVIDNSGSMSLSHEQVKKIVENAPGALVASYSETIHDKPNMYVLADKGRMVSAVPEQGAGNGVDFPAIEWAVKNRQRSSSPIVWVTDGGVCGKNSGFSESLALQCLKFAKKHNIVIVQHADEAIKELGKMKNGGKPQSQYPYIFKEVWRNAMGHELT